MSYPPDLEDKIERELIDKYGNEWDFLMGSSYHPKETENIEGSPRRVFWATMSTYVAYDGTFKRWVDHKEGYLKIVNAEKHYSFNDAINDLIQKMREFVGDDR